MKTTRRLMIIRSMTAASHVYNTHTAAAAGDEAKNAKNRDFDFAIGQNGRRFLLPNRQDPEMNSGQAARTRDPGSPIGMPSAKPGMTVGEQFRMACPGCRAG